MNAPTEAPESRTEPTTAPAQGHAHEPAVEPEVNTTGAGRKLMTAFFVALLALGAAFAAGLLPRLRDRAAVNELSREMSVPVVDVIHPGPAKAAPPLTLSGELRPIAETSIYARASGFVRKWTADIGAHVELGQVLAELDTPELDRQLAQARAELAQSEAALALSETTARRWREMLNTKAVSPQDADEKEADLNLKKATVEAGRANVQRLGDIIGFSKITAPFAGTITARRLDVGQLVTDGATQELFRIAKTDKLRVFVRVPQSYARAVGVGQVAELTVPELPGRKFTGKIVRTAGAMDASSRTLLTEIEVDNAKGELLAGSYSIVRLAEAHPEAALTLPANCLLFRPEGPEVAVVQGDHVVMRVVTLGRDFGSMLEILEGVQAANTVVVNPPDSIVDGMEVRVAPPKPPAPAPTGPAKP